MEVKAIKVTESNGKHGDSGSIGEVHISGGFISGAETLCGYVDTFKDYEATKEPVNCSGCKEIYQAIKSSRKRIKFTD